MTINRSNLSDPPHDEIAGEHNDHEKAELIVKVLKSRFPLSDKFLKEFFKAAKLVNFRDLDHPERLLNAEDPSAVKIKRFCSRCYAVTEAVCIKKEYVIASII